MEFEGEFETHVTVRAGMEAVRSWAEAHELKFHHIVLARGQTVSQPMLSRRGGGNLARQRAAASDLVRRLTAGGFVVERVKIEAGPGNQGIPESDAEASSVTNPAPGPRAPLKDKAPRFAFREIEANRFRS